MSAADATRRRLRPSGIPTATRRGAGDPSADASLRREQGAWLLAAAAITLAPHATHLPLWISLLCAALLSWRGLLLRQGRLPPHRALIMVLAVATAALIAVSFGQFFGKDPGVALLAALLGFKLLEARAARDIRAAVLLCFFLQVGLFFYAQSPLIAALAVGGALLATISLSSLHDDRATLRERLRTGSMLLAQGLPFMVALFVLFPRVEGPLWGLPADAYSGRSGLSDTMAPGSISALSLSDAIAFRARFAAAPPPPAQRYWRGPVLTDFDGRSWRAAPSRLAASPAYTPTGPRYDYRLTLEPHNQRWVLALDFPGPAPGDLRYADDYRLLAAVPIRHRSRFELSAFPATATGVDEDAATLARARALPAGVNPRARALGAAIAAATASDAERLARVLDQLRASGLVYTLEPPLLGRDSVDDFLFTTRRGFCEHFASAFVFLMRAAGVPARVVTGYQGGEINPVDRNLEVRQSDVHAWAEVWLVGRGWTRVDPTAVAAPRRIAEGLAAALPANEPVPALLRADLAWLRDLRYRWEALSDAWNQWILGYNPERQRELMLRLGLTDPDWRQLAALLGGSAAVLIAALFAWAMLQQRRSDPLDQAWARFCRKLARRGLPRRPSEGPIAYAERLAAARPRDAATLRGIAAAYARLRYRPGADPAAVRKLTQRIRRLRLS